MTTPNAVIDVHDLATFLHRLADRLRVAGFAIPGLTDTDRDRRSPAARAVAELASGLDAAANGLDLAAGCLCPRCRIVDVVERVEIRAGAAPTRMGRPGPTRT